MSAVLPAHDLLPRDGSVVMFMLVRRPDGRPTGYPMTGRISGGEMEITTYRKAAKARYLLADGRVCCVVPDPRLPGRGIALRARAEPAPGDAFAEGTRAADPSGAAIAVPAAVRNTVRDRLESGKRMVFRIHAERLDEIGERSSGEST